MIVFPKSGPKPGYYKTFANYLINIFNKFDTVVFDGVTEDTSYLIKINDKRVLFDFSDFYELSKNYSDDVPCFKFHYNRELHENYTNVFPFSPISFKDWDAWNKVKNTIKYTCNSDVVINCQIPHGDAVQRRKQVKKLLKERTQVETRITDKLKYWNRINNCLTHVFVPGARNDILDRGHFQYLSFGCCTIAPRINDVLPQYKMLIDGYHYLECKADYSDLIDIIEWCKNNREYCKLVGEHAKELFEETSTPSKLYEWVLKCLN